MTTSDSRQFEGKSCNTQFEGKSCNTQFEGKNTQLIAKRYFDVDKNTNQMLFHTTKMYAVFVAPIGKDIELVAIARHIRNLGKTVLPDVQEGLNVQI